MPRPPPRSTLIPFTTLFRSSWNPPGPFTKYVNGPFPLAVAVKFVAGSPAHTVTPVNPQDASGLTVTDAVASELLQPLTDVTKFEYVPEPAAVRTVIVVSAVFDVN